ncbi:MAG: nitrophenyl compound nitroreductase subunit ArsF family protein [Bacteroidales bacterium]
MKTIQKLFFFALLLAVGLQWQACGQKAKTEDAATAQAVQVQEPTSDELQAYYFHFSRRCVTCEAVESVSSNALKAMLGSDFQLKSLNLDEATTAALANKLGVSGQTLLLVKGEKQVDLTNEAFMNARSNPDKLTEALASAVEVLQ